MKTDLSDPQVFEAAVRTWSDRIYGLALRMTGDAEAAQEIAQETFARAWTNAASFRGESAVGTWLYRIAANLVFARTAGRGRRADLEEADSVPMRGLGPAALAEARVIGDRIREAVENLPKREREVFILREEAEMGHGEIGKTLGIAEGTSKVHYFRAVRRLRAMLEDLA